MNASAPRPQASEENSSIWKIMATPKGHSLLMLALAIFSLFFMTLAIFPAAPLVAKELKISPAEISGIFGISSLLATILSLPAGVLSDRNGRKPLIIGGLAIAGLSLIVCLLGGGLLPVFLIGWMLFGIGRGLFFSPMFTIPADLFDFRERGKAIGIITGAVGLGSVVGFVIGGLISEAGGWRALFIVGAALLLITTLIMVRLPETNKTKSSKSLGQEFRGSMQWLTKPGIAVASFIAAISFAVGICATFLTPFAAQQNHISPTIVAILFLPYEFVASVGAPIAGSIADRIGRRKPLFISLLCSTIALFALAIIGVNPITLLVCYSLVGLCEGPIVALTTAIVIDETMAINPRSMGAALGSYRLAQGVGLAFGTSIGGALLDNFGIFGSFATLGGLLLVLVIATFAVKERSKAASWRAPQPATPVASTEASKS